MNSDHMARKRHKGESCVEELLCFSCGLIALNICKMLINKGSDFTAIVRMNAINIFPRGRLVQIRMPINVRSSMFALLSTKGNLECEKIHEVWVWLLHLEPSDLDCTEQNTPGSFLPSCKPPLNLINKGEILSVMKFTLNHRFVSGHRDRSSDERIVCLCLYLYL